MMKYFRFSWEEILWGISWVNLVMLSATIPSYTKEDETPTTTAKSASDLREKLKKKR